MFDEMVLKIIFNEEMSPLKERLVAAGIHLVVSLLIAMIAAVLVFAVWYPYPFSELSGGRELFWLVVTVDVIMGPLLTFAIFNRAKVLKELQRDIAVVVLLQLGALSYGLWTVFEARPVHLVFEIDRFRVVHAADVDDQLLAKAPAEIASLPLFSRGLLAVRPFSSSAESAEATLAALYGVDLAARPDLWQPYDAASERVRKAAKPVANLIARFPDRIKEIEDALMKTGKSSDQLLSMPLVGRGSFWTVLLDAKTLEVVEFLPLDSFD